ncbi:MAG: hypothetical protein U0744_09705 [Gemmataceae bacterium]
MKQPVTVRLAALDTPYGINLSVALHCGGLYDARCSVTESCKGGA